MKAFILFLCFLSSQAYGAEEFTFQGIDLSLLMYASEIHSIISTDPVAFEEKNDTQYENKKKRKNDQEENIEDVNKKRKTLSNKQSGAYINLPNYKDPNIARIEYAKHQVLVDWFNDHLECPFPTQQDLFDLFRRTNMRISDIEEILEFYRQEYTQQIGFVCHPKQGAELEIFSFGSDSECEEYDSEIEEDEK